MKRLQILLIVLSIVLVIMQIVSWLSAMDIVNMRAIIEWLSAAFAAFLDYFGEE